jgi:hypothetical protein
MRRTLVLCAVLLTACEPNMKAADSSAPTAATPAPAPISLADVAGVWDATVQPVGRDTVVTTMIITATATNDGWSMKLPNGANPKVTVVSVAGDSIITTTGTFASATRKGQQVSTHNIFRLQGGKLIGITHAKYSTGDTTTLRVEGTKRAP